MDYYDDDFDDFDYDPGEHMASDPVDFYTGGYGGFGYDTSHVKANEKNSDLFVAATDGNLPRVQILVLSAAQNDKLNVINHARRWTEVDCKMSGFTKEYEWFGITPFTAAAQEGHIAVVKFLLEQGADPTLQGCPSDDVYLSATQAAEHAMIEAKRKVFKLRRVHAKDTSFTSAEIKILLPNATQSISDRAMELLAAQDQTLYGQELLKTALKFWPPNQNASSSFRKRSYELPVDFEQMKEALENVEEPSPIIYSNKAEDGEEQKLDSDLAKVIHGLEELTKRYDKEQKQEAEARERRATTNAKKKRKGKKQAHTVGAEAGPPSQAKCRFFAKGACRYGDTCRFSHDV